jgi:hypothetical protein
LIGDPNRTAQVSDQAPQQPAGLGAEDGFLCKLFIANSLMAGRVGEKSRQIADSAEASPRLTPGSMLDRGECSILGSDRAILLIFCDRQCSLRTADLLLKGDRVGAKVTDGSWFRIKP